MDVDQYRACELRQGTSEVVYLGPLPLLPAFDDLVNTSECSFSIDSRSEEVRHLALLTKVYDVVTSNFCRCARDQCDPDECHLGPSDVVKYAKKLDQAVKAISVETFVAIQPVLGLLAQARWVEVLLGHQWIAAHIWHIVVRHGIDMEHLEDGKYRHWPLEIIDKVARVMRTANIRSVHIQGTGMVSNRHTAGS